MNVIIFILIFFILCNWFQIKIFGNNLLQGKSARSLSKDKAILSLIGKKTGLQLTSFRLFHTDKLFATMFGFPGYVDMVISQGLLKSFNKDELEWVLLHEAAHFILWHPIKCAIAQLLGIIVGALLSNYFNNIAISAILAICFSFLFILFARSTEWEADMFSISRVDTVEGVITAQSKLAKHHGLTTTLLNWDIPTDQRIIMAEQEQRRRNNS